MVGGGQVLSPIRSHQHMRAGTRAQHVADYGATHPGTPHTIRMRGGEEGGDNAVDLSNNIMGAWASKDSCNDSVRRRRKMPQKNDDSCRVL